MVTVTTAASNPDSVTMAGLTESSSTSTVSAALAGAAPPPRPQVIARAAAATADFHRGVETPMIDTLDTD